MANITMDMIKELRERTGIGMMDCKRALQETDGDMDKAIRLLKERGAITAAKKNERTVKEGVIGFCINDDKTLVSSIELQCETDFVAKNEMFISLAENIAKTGMELKESNLQTLLDTKINGADTILAMINEGIQKWGEKTVLADFKLLKTDGFFGYYLHFTKKLATVVEFNVKAKTEKSYEIANQIAMHVASEKPIAVNRDGVPSDIVKEQKEIFEKMTRDSGKKEDMIPKIVEGKMSSWYSETVLTDQKLFSDNKITIKSLVDEISKYTGEEAHIKNFTIISLGV